MQDSNYIPVGMGVSSLDGTPMPILMDSTTGRILCEVVSNTPGIVPQRVLTDDNYEPTASGVSSIDGETVMPLTMVPYNQYGGLLKLEA